MKKYIIYINLFVLAIIMMVDTNGQSSTPITNLPDFLPPTPEAFSIQKANNLNVGYSTGSPSINIPLGELRSGSFRLPVTLNYSSTGIKVDEVASMAGMGWNLQYGGVISRVVFDKPDEYCNISNSNLTVNIAVENASMMNFLKNAPDKQSDIFTFSFGEHSGKFIIGNDGLPKQLTQKNLKIDVVNSNFLNGFIVRTDDGTAYHFEDAEIVHNHNPLGQNCSKTYDQNDVKTSWYLTKIVMPSTRRWIDFTYFTSIIAYESSITQTISKVIASQTHPCTNQPTCIIGSGQLSTCINKQQTTAKFISRIMTSEGDFIDFLYDAGTRTDLEGGKRLSSFKLWSRNGFKIREVIFNSNYVTAVNTTNSGFYYNPNAAKSRLFLDGLTIRGSEIGTNNAALTYSFSYIDKAGLPQRLSYAQDIYGYYNGKTTNGSLIPILPSSDINYSQFNSGTGNGTITFGNRSIVTSFSNKGLLEKITYPTAGYDIITYTPNHYLTAGVEKTCGGHAVSKITSYTDNNIKSGETEYIYRHKNNNNLSAFLLTENMVFSQQKTNSTDGYSCGITAPEGPQCTNAIVTSNANNPIYSFGGQHVYFRAVQEVIKGSSGDAGMTEHIYSLLSGSLQSYPRRGTPILNAPFNIIPDLIIGETNTNIYKSDGSAFNLVRSTERTFNLTNTSSYYSYLVNRNYIYTYSFNPPIGAEFDAFDIAQVYIDLFTIRNTNVVEKEYGQNGVELVTTSTIEYANPLYTYPTRITTIGSDLLQKKVERKYVPDITGAVPAAMVARNIINPVLEEKVLHGVNNDQLQLQTQTFWNVHNNNTVFAPLSSELKIKQHVQTQKLNFYRYDIYGNLLDAGKENDKHTVYLWDYNNEYVSAQVQNAEISEIAYTSFEADDFGNWSGINKILVVKDINSLTGNKHYNATNFSISKWTIFSNKKYFTTYWSKSATAFNVSGTQSGWPKNIRSQNINGQLWYLHEHLISGVTNLFITGSGAIDELRMYPEGAQMVTFTHEPLVGITTTSDAANHIQYYEYDGMHRLMLIRDGNKNVLKKFCYNYQGKPEQCAQYYNTIAYSGAFTKNNCPAGYGSAGVSYSVPVGKHSGITTAEANAKAEADYYTMGQELANRTQICYLICNASHSNCVGADKKCIGGFCRTGVKVYTSSVQIHGSLWECTFHYEWSDGSWSPNYTESSSSSCINVN